MKHLQELAIWLRMRRAGLRDLADECAEAGDRETSERYYLAARVLSDVLQEVRRRIAVIQMEGNDQ